MAVKKIPVHVGSPSPKESDSATSRAQAHKAGVVARGGGQRHQMSNVEKGHKPRHKLARTVHHLPEDGKRGQSASNDGVVILHLQEN